MPLRRGWSLLEASAGGWIATRVEAQRALRRTLERLCPGAVIMLAELVEELLEVNQPAPATIEKLRWLLAKATFAFGEVRVLDLRAEEICAWRETLPEGHRFEATQPLGLTPSRVSKPDPGPGPTRLSRQREF